MKRRYAHAEIRTQVVEICDQTHYRLDQGVVGLDWVHSSVTDSDLYVLGPLLTTPLIQTNNPLAIMELRRNFYTININQS